MHVTISDCKKYNNANSKIWEITQILESIVNCPYHTVKNIPYYLLTDLGHNCFDVSGINESKDWKKTEY